MFYYYHLWLSSLCLFLRPSSRYSPYLHLLRMGTFFTLVALSGLAGVLHYTQSVPVEVSCLFTIMSVSVCASVCRRAHVALPGLPNLIKLLENRGWTGPWVLCHQISIMSLTC